MLNKKGQALVEFIIILPIIIILMLAVFDFVKIMQTKMNLESTIEEVILDDTINLDKDINLTKKDEDNYTTYTVTKNVDITSPILSAILKNKYEVKVTRSIYAK